ncbi:autotransporter outer membrane beta-barrel domain-containing protein [Methylobacterium oryzihabitans]|uniref:Autotransporter outer membrane beta-barrel domain-containing protein n=1 Tax=Methylobacterium oryzihabitans TaxID=2499852 RepID=A0A3S2VQS7_9HYPH|nr:nidogen-like domain-containing protein [Methylobacterium oryzihabitans]RVU14950.1 autotransporter outer membrane beta-barrel domain-containing protein [Methylobacterium oryzihabitans]
MATDGVWARARHRQGLGRVRRALLLGVAAGIVTPGVVAAQTIVTPGVAAAQRVVPGFDSNQLARNDDSSTGAVALPFAANYFGTTYNQLYVNNNGNVTFGRASGSYTPVGLGADYRGSPIIAPFFADIDTSNPASGITSYGNGSFAGRTAFGATWPGVGYFSSRADKTNTFQLILTDRADTGTGNFDIYFNYARIQFETGNANGGTNGLGGTSASAGYSNGSGEPGTYFELPGSLVNGALIDGGPNALATSSNNGVAGQFLFPVRNGTVLFANVCRAGDNASTTTVANCGPSQTYNGGILYTPSGSFILNVLDNTTINAVARGTAVLVTPASATPGTDPAGSVTINVAASATISSPTGTGIEIDNAQGTGASTVANQGTVTAGTLGILARAGSGILTVTNGGTVTAPLGVVGASSSSVSVTNTGTIAGAAIGIAALAPVATVRNGGGLSFNEVGIAAYGLASVSVENTGTITQDASIPALPSALRAGLPQLAQLTQTFSQFGAGILADGATQAFRGIGIAALGNGGAIVNSGTITAPAAGIAAYAEAATGSFGLGDLSITNSGTITATAGIGVVAFTSGGNLTVTNSGTIAGVTGLVAGIRSQQSGTLAITNTGTVSGLGGYAIDTSASAVASRIDNRGVILGTVALSNGSTLSNAGLFSTAGTSSFGSGTVENTGVIALAAQSPTDKGPVSATFGGISTFTNAGTIDLRTGSAANRLVVQGDYVGRDGTLLLDAASATGASDRLVVTGSAAGTTRLFVNNVTPGAAFTTSPVLVEVGGALTPGAFRLAGAQNFGALEVALVNGAGSGGGGTVALATVPSAVGLSAPTAVIASRTIAFQGGTAVLDRMTQLRTDAQRAASGTPSIPQAMQYAGLNQYSALVSKDPIAPNLVKPVEPVPSNVRPAAWARAYGDLERRSGSSSFSVGGTSFVRDLGYSQSGGGLLGGADLVISRLTKEDDGLVIGIMGGYTTADVRLNRNAGRQDYEGGTVGVYGTYLNGPWFWDHLFKVDLLGLDIRAPGLLQRTGLQNYAYTTNVGYRIPLEHAIYVEPTAGLEYVATTFNQQAALTATSVPLRDGDALRGRIGARVGSEFVEGDIRVEPSVTGFVYSVLTESGVTGAVNGVTGVTGLREQGKVRGEVQASVNFFNLKTGLSGFVRADYRIGGDLVGGGGRVGMRYQW